MAGVITPAQYVGGGGGGAVSSVFGRSGVVIAATGDYTVAQVTGAASQTFVTTSVATETARAEAAEALLAPLASLGVLTTAGDLIIENATPTPARLPVGTAGQSLQVAAGLPAWAMGMTLLAATAVAGYTLVNGTGNIITWTAPNDGNLHRIFLAYTIHITSAETGGQITLAWNAPDGGVASHTVTAAGTAATVGGGSLIMGVIVEAGQTVTLSQATALTAGAAVLWAELWGS
jgi:hypothetical protein